MPKPNRFKKATAQGFDAAHEKGISVTVHTLTGTTAAQNVFGANTGFDGVITGVMLNTLGATAATVTLTNNSTTVCTLTGGSTVATIKGTNAALANTTLTKSGTLTLASNSASDTSQVWIAYKVS